MIWQGTIVQPQSPISNYQMLNDEIRKKIIIIQKDKKKKTLAIISQKKTRAHLGQPVEPIGQVMRLNNLI